MTALFLACAVLLAFTSGIGEKKLEELRDYITVSNGA